MICHRLAALKENPGGRAAGAYCSCSTLISRSRQEVFVYAQRDRQVVHILNGGARRLPRGRPISAGHVIIGRQEGPRVKPRQLIPRQ
jgi:hypothetical protein